MKVIHDIVLNQQTRLRLKAEKRQMYIGKKKSVHVMMDEALDLQNKRKAIAALLK